MTTDFVPKYSPCKRISDQICTMSTQIQVQRTAFKHLPMPVDGDKAHAIEQFRIIERSGLDTIVAAAEMVSVAREELRRLSL